MKIKNFFVLTGAMGGGKSAVLKHIRKNNFKCIDEPARQILKEQRRIKGKGVPEKDPELFCQLMLSRSVHLFQSNADYKDTVVFDRGIPDMIAYADLFGIDKNIYMNAAKVYSYNNIVFMFNGIEEIYTTDDERKMNYKAAEKFGFNVKEIYKELGYYVTDVPYMSEEERSSFIIETIEKII
ncbi:MAG TPA: AAA family ATPase [Ignavibacteria bacterium]|nr:ATPase [Bacteroidota bacterium]HRI84922.1 AAA family ATPase [Ignavibacteria bacterium]HRJ99565.1 AAA family ATPase [Ignavibacteria bacterium]